MPSPANKRVHKDAQDEAGNSIIHEAQWRYWLYCHNTPPCWRYIQKLS